MKDVAIQAAQEASKLLMQNLGKIKEISFKQANDYLTNVDIEAENTIKDIIKSAFPDHGFVAEESEFEQADNEYVWFIDPLSSTKNFVHGLPHFATALALRKNNEFIISVVQDPFYNEIFYAEKNKGAYLNNRRITVSQTNELSKSMLFVGIHNKGNNRADEGINYFEKVTTEISDFRRFGSTALQLCYIACGRVDGFTHNHSDIFAIPSGKVIVEEAGGRVTDFEGNDWNINSKTLLASNGFIHDNLIEVLNR